MRLFFVSLRMQLSRMLRRPGVWACLLAMPALVLLAGIGAQADGDAAVIVGLYAPEEDARAQNVAAYLARLEGDLRFERVESTAALERGVAGNVYECGYILPGDFTRRAEDQDWRGGIRVVVSPATTMAPLVNEVVSAAVFREAAPDIAYAFIQAKQLLPLSGAELQALGETYFAREQVMQVTLQSLAGQPTPQDGSAKLATVAVLRGLVAVVLFLFALLCLVWYGQDKQTGFFGRLRPYTGPVARFAPTLLAGLLPAGLVALCTLGLGNRFAPGLWLGAGRELPALAAYMVMLAGITLLCGVFVRTAWVPVAAMPFLLVACLLLCPVLLDVGAYFPTGAALSLLLPPTHYLRAAAGQGGCAVMLATGLVCALLALVAGRLAKKRGI